MNKAGLIQIGESIHASIPRCGAALKELTAKGARAFQEPGEALDYVISLITGQTQNHADYLGINVDDLGRDDPQLALNMMRALVELVQKHSRRIPVCIDSSDNNVLKAGLQQWYNHPTADLAAPLINSVKTYTIDQVLPLREQYPFKVVGMLVDDKQAGPDGTYSIDNLHEMARTIFAAATDRYGFEPADIFFDTTVFPLAIDMPMTPGASGYTYRTFEAIRTIMNDPDMKGVHTMLGLSNCAKDLPGRKVGVCRAYLALARRCGLDGAIVNVMHRYDQKPAPPELLELVEAFVGQDGSQAAGEKAVKLITEFCRANRQAQQNA
jgi:5-methyltetrahydrofolate corrinoid/iron sulfur protein methyltransferase